MALPGLFGLLSLFPGLLLRGPVVAAHGIPSLSRPSGHHHPARHDEAKGNCRSIDEPHPMTFTATGSSGPEPFRGADNATTGRASVARRRVFRGAVVAPTEKVPEDESDHGSSHAVSPLVIGENSRGFID